LGLSNAFGFVYEDFSSDFDGSKWLEAQDPEGQPLTEEHFVDLVQENYHTANYSAGDRRTVLNLVGHTFLPGETLEYDVDYIDGSGNRAIVIFVDGGPLDRATTTPYSGGSIGHNAVDFMAGNDFGLYHVKLEFKETGIDITIIRPDTSVYFEEMPITTWIYGGEEHSTEPPFEVGFETWSGGSIHADYDNFEINTSPVLQPFEEISVNELAKVKIIPEAFDADGDELIFSIDDNRFIWNNDLDGFVWDTNQTDSGNYVFTVTVSDGVFEVSQPIQVTVKDTCHYESYINGFICLYPYPPIRFR